MFWEIQPLKFVFFDKKNKNLLCLLNLEEYHGSVQFTGICILLHLMLVIGFCL